MAKMSFFTYLKKQKGNIFAFANSSQLEASLINHRQKAIKNSPPELVLHTSLVRHEYPASNAERLKRDHIFPLFPNTALWDRKEGKAAKRQFYLRERKKRKVERKEMPEIAAFLFLPFSQPLFSLGYPFWALLLLLTSPSFSRRKRTVKSWAWVHRASLFSCGKWR